MSVTDIIRKLKQKQTTVMMGVFNYSFVYKKIKRRMSEKIFTSPADNSPFRPVRSTLSRHLILINKVRLVGQVNQMVIWGVSSCAVFNFVFVENKRL